MSKLRTVAPRKSARVLERTSCWTEQRHSTILFVQFWAEVSYAQVPHPDDAHEENCATEVRASNPMMTQCQPIPSHSVPTSGSARRDPASSSSRRRTCGPGGDDQAG